MTLFVIFGIILVAGILIFFFVIEPTFIDQGGKRIGFEGCVQDVVEDGIAALEASSGFIDPDFTYRYDDEDIPYLCYTNEFYQTCTVQLPFLKQHFEGQLEILTRGDIDSCYENSLSELRSQGYEVKTGTLQYHIVLEPGITQVKIDAPTTVEDREFTKFNVRLDNTVYETLMIATSVIQGETSYGDFNADAVSLLYPDYFLDKIKRGDGTTVYILENHVNGNKFKFASRSLVFPAGFSE